MQGREGHEVGLAVDAAQAPEAAPVQVARGGRLVNAEGHQIALARLEGLGDVEVESREAAFVVADALAVDEDLGAVVHAVEMPEHALAGKGGRYIHPAAIEADVVGQLAGAFLVREDREALDFPIGGYGDVLPVGVRRIGGGEGRHGGVSRQFTLDRRADAVFELETPRARHGQYGGVAQPQAIDGDGRIAGHGHGRGEGRWGKQRRGEEEGNK